MVTYVFPGQGSQTKGMGGTLFNDFKELTSKADNILGYSIEKLCTKDPEQNLNQTQYTQPALFVVNSLSYLKKIQTTDKKPNFVAGHSLGEYNALFAAGVFSFETGVELVKKRGELMGQIQRGGMAAVIGLDEEQIVDVLKRHKIDTIDIANYNSPFQIVISGPKSDIENVQPIFEKINDVKMFIPIKTSGAFHSRYMETVKQEFKRFIGDFNFLTLSIPVISTFTARPYKQGIIKENLIEQIDHPVKWTESIRFLMGQGEMEFEEIGPGKVLAGLIQRIRKEADPLIVPGIEWEVPVQAIIISKGGEK